MNLLQIETDFELSEALSPIKHVTSDCGGRAYIYDVLFRVRNLHYESDSCEGLRRGFEVTLTAPRVNDMRPRLAMRGSR